MDQNHRSALLALNRTLAVIMGGGAGTRLFPLTKDRAKPAVPLGGKYRLVDIPISNCLNSGLRKIYLLTQFNSSSLHRHVQRSYKFDDFSQGFVEIMAAQQTAAKVDGWYQGTADAVRQNLVHFANEAHDYIIILSGDQLYRMDYRPMLAQHIETGSDITVGTIPVDREAAKGFGIMHIDGERRIIQFVEKPKKEEELDELRLQEPTLSAVGGGSGKDLYLASMGIYIFNRQALQEALDNNHLDFGKDIIPGAIQRGKLHAHVYRGYWEDIGTIKAFFAANLDLCEAEPQFDFLSAEGPIYTRPRTLPATKVEKSFLERTVLADGCVIKGATIKHTLVGIRSIIGSGVTIEDTVLMGADYYDSPSLQGKNPPLGIGYGTSIKRCIVDKNARIGKYCKLSPEGKADNADHPLYHIRDGIMVIPKNTVVPDGTVI